MYFEISPLFSINDTDMNGFTALHYACLYADLAAVKELLQFPQVDVNLCNEQGETALMM